MSEELKPCPFCGGEASNPYKHRFGGYFIFCKWCGAEIGSPNSIEEAIENWNTRPKNCIELPCKIGDTVYIVVNKYRAGRNVNFINTGKFKIRDLENLNKSVFLTKEAAEKALEEQPCL